MYPIKKHYVGQRVTVFGSGVGTVAVVLGNAVWTNVVVVFDDPEMGRHACHAPEVMSLIPNNDDRYFDGPPGYVDAG